MNATYWAHGALNVLNGGSSPLPGLPAITYGASDGSGIDGKGRLTKVTAASGQNPVTCTTAPCVAYNVADQITGITFGSGDNDAYQYDSNTGRFTQFKFNMGTGPQSQTGALTWNANGTVQKLQITDQINSANSQTCKFGDPSASVAGYDDLGRLIKADCASAWSQTFAFDPFGNLSKSGSAQFLPTYTGSAGAGSPTNQYYQIPGGASGTSNYYDANGNLKNDITHAYTWDADGNMLSVDGSTVSMTFDALDRMVEITKGSAHTEIAYAPYGMKLALMNGQTLVEAFVKLPGGARAVYNNSGLAYYRHSDHLGSSRLATTPSRTKYYDVAYAPYGEDYNQSGTTDLAFTDQNQDTVAGGFGTNLYDFLMREYRTAHGRWTSPDPGGVGVVDPTNPQTWNRYAYAQNNPLAMIDMFGDDACYANGAQGCGYYIDGMPVTAAFFYAQMQAGNINMTSGRPGDCYPGKPCQISLPSGDQVFAYCGDSNQWVEGYLVDVDCQHFGDALRASLKSDSTGWAWAWNSTTSFFGGFRVNAGPGSCIAAGLASYAPVVNAFKKTRDYAKDIGPVIGSLPALGASVSTVIYNSVRYGADKMSARVMAGAASATTMFLYTQGQLAVDGIASAARNPAVALGAIDLALLWGVGNEAAAAQGGRCY